MTSGFKVLRHKLTGKVDSYPAHFAEWDVFEAADPDEGCVDCVVQIPDALLDEGDEDGEDFSDDDNEEK